MQFAADFRGVAVLRVGLDANPRFLCGGGGNGGSFFPPMGFSIGAFLEPTMVALSSARKAASN